MSVAYNVYSIVFIIWLDFPTIRCLFVLPHSELIAHSQFQGTTTNTTKQPFLYVVQFNCDVYTSTMIL
jgi:hypothetical protein